MNAKIPRKKALSPQRQSGVIQLQATECQNSNLPPEVKEKKERIQPRVSENMSLLKPCFQISNIQNNGEIIAVLSRLGWSTLLGQLQENNTWCSDFFLSEILHISVKNLYSIYSPLSTVPSSYHLQFDLSFSILSSKPLKHHAGNYLLPLRKRFFCRVMMIDDIAKTSRISISFFLFLDSNRLYNFQLACSHRK